MDRAEVRPANGEGEALENADKDIDTEIHAILADAGITYVADPEAYGALFRRIRALADRPPYTAWEPPHAAAIDHDVVMLQREIDERDPANAV